MSVSVRGVLDAAPAFAFDAGGVPPPVTEPGARWAPAPRGNRWQPAPRARRWQPADRGNRWGPPRR